MLGENTARCLEGEYVKNVTVDLSGDADTPFVTLKFNTDRHIVGEQCSPPTERTLTLYICIDLQTTKVTHCN
jgi:hypothetical protein